MFCIRYKRTDLLTSADIKQLDTIGTGSLHILTDVSVKVVEKFYWVLMICLISNSIEAFLEI